MTRSLSDARLPSRADVLKLLSGNDRAFHAKEIATQLGVSDAKYQGLLRLLDNWTFDGVLPARDGHRFKLSWRQRERHPAELALRPRLVSRAGPGQAEREGVLRVNPRGFGFVSSVGAEKDDVFIP